jgi:hypothetical protein
MEGGSAVVAARLDASKTGIGGGGGMCVGIRNGGVTAVAPGASCSVVDSAALSERKLSGKAVSGVQPPVGAIVCTSLSHASLPFSFIPPPVFTQSTLSSHHSEK